MSTFRSMVTSVTTSMATLLLLTMTFMVTGCETLFGDDGWFPDQSSDYLQASESQSLQFPEHSEGQQTEDQYPIPELAFANVLPNKYQVPRVDSLDNIEGKGSVRIQNFQDRQWIIVKRSPSQTWPLVLQFLESNQIKLLNKQAEDGVIETDWLVVAASVKKITQIPNEKYQFSLASGVQENSTEISVLQVNLESTENIPAQWPLISNSKAREDNMVNLLAEHLAGSPEQSSHSLLAQGMGSASKAVLAFNVSGDPYINLQLSFDRGWAALNLALKKAKFKVTDLNRSEGIYYAKFERHEKNQKKPGFLKRMFSVFSKAKIESVEGDLLIISAKQEDETLIIAVQRNSAVPLEPNEQAFMLRRILNKLS